MSNPVAQAQAQDEVDTSYDTSEPEQVNKVRKKSARTRADRLEFVAAALTTEQGRSWFYDIMRRCKVFQGPYVGGDPYATAFRCGEQNVGLMVMDDVQTASPENYIKMVSENKDKNG